MRYVLFLAWAGTVVWAQTKPAAKPPAAPQAQQPDQNQPPGEESSAQSTPAPQPGAQQPASQQPDATAVQSAMAASIAKQRVAVMAQVAGVMGKAPTPAPSFYTV